LRLGDNRRLKGEDIAKGHAALLKGEHISPAALGLVASLGIKQVPVYRRLKVAYFSTGDEILSLGELPREGAVYDSNRYTVFGMLSKLGCEVIDLGVVPDDPVLLEAAFADAAGRCDAIITSGGVSVGEADFTKAMMKKLGDVEFWKIAKRAVVWPAWQPGRRDGDFFGVCAPGAAPTDGQHCPLAAFTEGAKPGDITQKTGPHRIPTRHRQQRRRRVIDGQDNRQPGLRRVELYGPGQRFDRVAPPAGSRGTW
jgi:molybdenum cofactor synthesis domain-containing protein